MKKLLKLALAGCASGFVFFNLTVVHDSKSESNFKLSALSDVFAQTESGGSSVTSSAASSVTSSTASSSATSSVTSSATSSTTSSSEPPVPSSWSVSNPWGTGVGYYKAPRTLTVGMTLTDTSKDGGATWAFGSDLPAGSVTFGPPQGSGDNLTRTITFLQTYTIIECHIGGSDRCDGPLHMH